MNSVIVLSLIVGLAALQATATDPTNVTFTFHGGETAIIPIQNLTNRPDCYYSLGSFDAPNSTNHFLLQTKNLENITEIEIKDERLEQYNAVCYEKSSKECDLYTIITKKLFVYDNILRKTLKREQLLPKTTDPNQYYPTNMRKSSEFTMFTTKSDMKAGSEGLFLISNNLEKFFIHLVYPFAIGNSVSITMVASDAPNVKMMLMLDSQKKTITASSFNVTPDAWVVYNDKDITTLNANDVLGLKDEIRVIEGDTTERNIVYVIVGNTLYVFKIEHLNQPWKLLGSVSNDQYPTYSYNCRMRKITDFLVVDCYYAGVLARYNVSDMSNPRNTEYIALREMVVDMGVNRFIYSITKSSWRCQLTIYDLATKSISLRFRHQLEGLDVCYGTLPVAAAPLDYSNDLFFLYTNKLYIYRLSTNQELMAKIPKVRDPSYSECYQAEGSSYECAYALNLTSYCDATPQHLAFNLKLKILPPVDAVETVGVPLFYPSSLM